MIENLKLSIKEGTTQFDLSNGVFATFNSEKGDQSLYLEDVVEYWEYATEDDIESISIRSDEDRIIAEFSCASGQGGVVTVWDEDGKLIHVSNGEYGIASAIFEDKVYTLRAIVYYGHPLSYSMTSIPLGTMDAWQEAEEVEGFVFSDAGAHAAFVRGESITLYVAEDTFKISYVNEVFEINR